MPWPFIRAGLITSVGVPQMGVVDVMVSFVFLSVLIPIFVMGKANMSRLVGGVLLASYVAYMSFRAIS